MARTAKKKTAAKKAVKEPAIVKVVVEPPVWGPRHFSVVKVKNYRIHVVLNHRNEPGETVESRVKAARCKLFHGSNIASAREDAVTLSEFGGIAYAEIITEITKTTTKHVQHARYDNGRIVEQFDRSFKYVTKKESKGL